MKKVKEWIRDGKPQFTVEVKIPTGHIDAVRRIKDGGLFVSILIYKSDDSQTFFIEKFHEDCIHLNFVTNLNTEYEFKGVCEINSLIIKLNNNNEVVLYLPGQIDGIAETITNKTGTAHHYSD